MSNRFRRAGLGFAVAALAGAAGCATAAEDGSSRYQLVTTPGPRGTTRQIRSPQPASPEPCPSLRPTSEGPQYRLVTTPGPRGTTRAVRVKGADASCR
jgi:hypothetical protein